MSGAASTTSEPVETTRIDQAARIISSSCVWAAGAGFIPVPFIDVVALAAVQAHMADSIAKLYGQSFRKEVVESTVSVLLATLIPSALTGTVASGVKAIPIVGTVAGFVLFPAFASAATYAMGRVLVRHFEKGGTVVTFTADRVRDDLRKEFQSAQTTAT